jgi:dipeptidyl aminopeptidase/acylaminoacyl peptidase
VVTVAPYGSWTSPIRVDDVIGGAIAFGEVWVDGADIFWLEGRPSEAGRRILVRRAPDGTIHDLTPAGFNVRTRVHEYGGGSLVIAGGWVIFSNFADGRLYAQPTDGAQPADERGEPVALTPEGPWRYADLRVDASRNRIVAVREDHGGTGEALNAIVTLPVEGGTPEVIIEGHDFVAAPRISPDGQRLAWLAWDHPNLPWDGTTLWLAELDDEGRPVDPEPVAGGSSEWIAQPRWAPDGELWFVAERDEWPTLMTLTEYRAGLRVRMPAEFAPPDWVFDRPTYAILDDGQVIAAARAGGRDRLWSLVPDTGVSREIDASFTEIGFVVAAGSSVVFVGGRSTDPTAIVRLDTRTGRWEVLRTASETQIDPGFLSAPQSIAFPSAGSTAHALFYPPRNREFAAPDSDRPPLIVRSHGGPTAAASTALNLAIQLLTSRGYAVVDVDYGGSTGYGRAYRKRLEGRWGVVDMDDCVAAARFLADRGDADAERLCITGGSAGGYTTLAALTFRDTFAAGISYFGIGDLETFVRDTHKFESRYMDRLVGPYPEAASVYRERSPIHFLERLSCPLLILQGLDDRVVPPNQAQDMADALRAKGLPFTYLAFEGEGHGFRGQNALRRSLEAELSFLAQVFGLAAPPEIEPIELIGATGTH